MTILRPLTIACVLSCCCLLTGCGTSTSTTADMPADNDEFLGALLNDLDAQDNAAADDVASPSPDTSPRSDSLVPTTPVVHSAASEQLQLKLQIGDRFPLVKTIRQNLVQTSVAFPANATSELEMHMLIQVDDVNANGILMNVRYTRITYSHEVSGQSVAFDSETHQGDVPAAILPYAGMVNNGFSFWLGRDNRIQQVVGYREFLQRCVQHVPAERRESLLTEVSARFGDDGVANFIDDSVGLLPYNQNVAADDATRVSVGDVWYRERRLQASTPVTMKSTCRLLSLDESTAEIDITGQIANGEFYEVSSTGQTRVQVRSGRSMGSCVIDRATGLPLNLNRSRHLNLIVTAADGQVFEQEKRIETTIQTYPNSRGPVVRAQDATPQTPAMELSSRPLAPAQQLRPMPGQGFSNEQQFGITQVNAIEPLRGERVLRPAVGTQPMPLQIDTSHLQSDVRAVYPN